MKKLAILLALAPAIVLAQASPKAITEAPAFSWAGAAVYDVKTHRWNAIVLNNTFPLHTPGGRNTGFSIGLFGGAAGNSQANALAGAGLMVSKIIFQEVSGWLMVGGDVQGGATGAFHGVIGGGLAIRF